MKKHLSIKLFIAVIALTVYSFLVMKNGKSLNAESSQATVSTDLSSQTPQAPAPEAPVAN